ncbi:MAG: SCP2 sterol-binding domain-containing protein [Planctomycetes bacterium]|nr:SCP2 sterol-binding domain-containing protein [Planctomycetota bacterium]
MRHIRQTVAVRYGWSCGKNLTLFYRETRDRKRFVGRRCPKCRAVHVPPVEVCGKCFARCEEGLVEVGPGGRLDSWTTVHLPFPGQPTEPPYVFAMIQLDGSNTLLSHRVAGAQEEDLRIGMRVEPVWSEERKGNLHDVLYFRPAVASALQPSLASAPPRGGFAPSAGGTATPSALLAPGGEASPPAPPSPPLVASARALDTAEPRQAPAEPERAPEIQKPGGEKMEITVHDIFHAMEKNFLPAGAGDWKAAIQFEIAGPGGGDWLVRIGEGKCSAGPGRADAPSATVSTSAETWIGMVTGSVNPQMAFMTGKLKVKGNMGDVMKLSNPKIFPKKPAEK